MKCQIITAEGTQKVCSCGSLVFRKSTKTKYTNEIKTKGVTYNLTICDKCGAREEFNPIMFRIGKSIIRLSKKEAV